jgi:hypothetical protein
VWRNNRPKCIRTHFGAKFLRTVYRDKKVAQNFGLFCLFQKAAQSKQSPNLATLFFLQTLSGVLYLRVSFSPVDGARLSIARKNPLSILGKDF